MQKKELIIFDMDGTLINSGNVITNTINFVRGHLNLKPIPKSIMLEQINNPDINSSEYFYGTKEFTPTQTELFTKYYNEHCISDIELYDGIFDMLDTLSNYFTLSIATNASKDFALKMIKHLQIDNYFELIVGASCVNKPKPYPDMVIKTLNDLEVCHTKAILIGDSHKDTRAASAANIDSMLVSWGFTNHETEDSIITNSKELYDKLLELK